MTDDWGLLFKSFNAQYTGASSFVSVYCKYLCEMIYGLEGIKASRASLHRIRYGIECLLQ